MLVVGSVVRVQVIDSAEAFATACDTLRAGTGPFAVDAERASGFTYSQRAYLIQIHRRGSGTFLFDPPPLGDMSALSQIAGDEEWVIHAATFRWLLNIDRLGKATLVPPPGVAVG
jgi:ribonuclease D